MSNLRFVERDGKMILQEVQLGHSGFTNWVDVPTHKEPKKVSEELESVVLKAAEYDQNLLWHESVAKAAIEFFKARMPKSIKAVTSEEQAYYNMAIKDVRKALFVEE